MSDAQTRKLEIEARLDRSLANLEASTKGANHLDGRLDRQLADTGAAFDRLLGELTVAANRLQETLDVIRSDPAVILWGRSVPEREFKR